MLDDRLTEDVVCTSRLSTVACIVSKTAAVAHLHIGITIDGALRENRSLVEVLGSLVSLVPNLELAHEERRASLLSCVLLARRGVGRRPLHLV